MAQYVRMYPYTRASIEIPYRFVCEHCCKDSGIMIYKITGSQQVGGTPVKEGENVTVEDLESLRLHAKNALKEEIDHLKDSVEKGVYPEVFKGTCHHCKKSQSWNGSGSIKNLFLYPLSGAFYISVAALVIMFFVNYFSGGKIGMLDMLYPSLIVSAIGALLGFIFALFSVIKVKLDTKNIGRKNKPQILWPDISRAKITQ